MYLIELIYVTSDNQDEDVPFPLISHLDESNDKFTHGDAVLPLLNDVTVKHRSILGPISFYTLPVYTLWMPAKNNKGAASAYV